MNEKKRRKIRKCLLFHKSLSAVNIEFLKSWFLYLSSFVTETWLNFKKTCLWTRTIIERSLCEWSKREIIKSVDEICQNGGFSRMEIWKSWNCYFLTWNPVECLKSWGKIVWVLTIQDNKTFDWCKIAIMCLVGD